MDVWDKIDGLLSVECASEKESVSLIREAARLTVVELLSLNERIAAREGMALVPQELLETMHRRILEIGDTGAVPVRLLVLLASLKEILLRWQYGALFKPQDHRAPDKRPSSQWEALSTLIARHSSLAEELGSDGWPERYQNGPRLFRGTNRPGLRGGA